MPTRFSIRELSEKTNVDIESARGLVKFLTEIGACEHMGERKNENSRGAREGIYMLHPNYEHSLVRTLRAARLD